ncbi:MAG TPA: hypothetical protein VKP69_12645, partial [Isosphaeraceae bacterium]|nr:hypothetical protein [Isosphaeraceae bacterium]
GRPRHMKALELFGPAGRDGREAALASTLIEPGSRSATSLPRLDPDRVRPTIVDERSSPPDPGRWAPAESHLSPG